MEIDSLLQLSLSLQAVLLGWALGLLYDLLRALRLRCQTSFAAAALDVLYGLSVPTLLFFFALRVAGGELRVYQLLCFAGGAVFFFTACSRLLRPLWDFWTDVLLHFVSLCLLPFRFLHRLGKKFVFYSKKLFHFRRKYYIISQHRRRFPHGKRRTVYGTRKQKTSFSPADSAGTGCAGHPDVAARGPRRTHQRRQGSGKGFER